MKTYDLGSNIWYSSVNQASISQLLHNILFILIIFCSRYIKMGNKATKQKDEPVSEFKLGVDGKVNLINYF